MLEIEEKYLDTKLENISLNIQKHINDVSAKARIDNEKQFSEIHNMIRKSNKENQEKIDAVSEQLNIVEVKADKANKAIGFYRRVVIRIWLYLTGLFVAIIGMFKFEWKDIEQFWNRLF